MPHLGNPVNECGNDWGAFTKGGRSPRRPGHLPCQQPARRGLRSRHCRCVGRCAGSTTKRWLSETSAPLRSLTPIASDVSYSPRPAQSFALSAVSTVKAALVLFVLKGGSPASAPDEGTWRRRLGAEGPGAGQGRPVARGRTGQSSGCQVLGKVPPGAMAAHPEGWPTSWAQSPWQAEPGQAADGEPGRRALCGGHP